MWNKNDRFLQECHRFAFGIFAQIFARVKMKTLFKRNFGLRDLKAFKPGFGLKSSSVPPVSLDTFCLIQTAQSSKHLLNHLRHLAFYFHTMTVNKSSYETILKHLGYCLFFLSSFFCYFNFLANFFGKRMDTFILI